MRFLSFLLCALLVSVCSNAQEVFKFTLDEVTYNIPLSSVITVGDNSEGIIFDGLSEVEHDTVFIEKTYNQYYKALAVRIYNDVKEDTVHLESVSDYVYAGSYDSLQVGDQVQVLYKINLNGRFMPLGAKSNKWNDRSLYRSNQLMFGGKPFNVIPYASGKEVPIFNSLLKDDTNKVIFVVSATQMSPTYFSCVGAMQEPLRTDTIIQGAVYHTALPQDPVMSYHYGSSSSVKVAMSLVSDSTWMIEFPAAASYLSINTKDLESSTADVSKYSSYGFASDAVTGTISKTYNTNVSFSPNDVSSTSKLKLILDERTYKYAVLGIRSSDEIFSNGVKFEGNWFHSNSRDFIVDSTITAVNGTTDYNVVINYSVSNDTMTIEPQLYFKGYGDKVYGVVIGCPKSDNWYLAANTKKSNLEDKSILDNLTSVKIVKTDNGLKMQTKMHCLIFSIASESVTYFNQHKVYYYDVDDPIYVGE